MAIGKRFKREGGLRLGALGCLVMLGCNASSPTQTAAGSPGSSEQAGITVVVNGESRDFSSATTRLCSEGLPEELMVIVTTAGPDCPEQFTQGPAGNRLSRGRLCDELLVQVRDFELGAAVAAQGSPASLVAYSRYEAPTLFLSTGDSGPRSTTGSITIREFHQMPGGEYRLDFAVSLRGAAEVSASGAVSVVPEFCTAA